MNPWFLLVAITAGIAGGVVLSAYLGYKFARVLKSCKPKSWLGRIFCNYKFWAVVSGLFMCATIFSAMGNPVVIPGFLCLMILSLVAAQELEPPVKVCPTCHR